MSLITQESVARVSPLPSQTRCRCLHCRSRARQTVSATALCGFEVLQRPEVGVVLDRNGELLADIVREARRRREIEPGEAVEIRIQNGIGDQVEPAEVRADNRAHLS